MRFYNLKACNFIQTSLCSFKICGRRLKTLQRLKMYNDKWKPRYASLKNKADVLWICLFLLTHSQSGPVTYLKTAQNVCVVSSSDSELCLPTITLFLFLIFHFFSHAGIVHFLQYYYQSGCLYRLRALGEKHNMDITVGEFIPNRRHSL